MTTRSGYKPELDGIRALAVLSVLLFHTHTKWFPWLRADGGLMGVDLFFVLSGFLITSLLVGEYGRTGGISRRNFYARRVLRLVPALVLAIAFGGIIAARWGNGGSGSFSYPRAALTTFFFAGNWFSGRLGLLTPLWSLGLEEQYYIVWPFVLLIALRRRVSLLKLAAGSAVFAVLIAIMRSAVFHSTTSSKNWWILVTSGWIRADGIFLGSALALVLASRRGEDLKRLLRGSPLGYAAAICLTALFVRARFDEVSSFDGIFLVNCCAVLVIAHAAFVPRSPLSRLLRTQPLPAIGRMSYGIYIFQGPMLVLAAHLGTGLEAAVIAWAGTFALAIVSYVLVERPALSLKSRLRSTDRVDANIEVRRVRPSRAAPQHEPG